jgi:hypothetical protein
MFHYARFGSKDVDEEYHMKPSEAAAVDITSEAGAASHYADSSPMMQKEPEASAGEGTGVFPMGHPKTPPSPAAGADKVHAHGTEPNEVTVDLINVSNSIGVTSETHYAGNVQSLSEAGSPRHRAASWCQHTGSSSARLEVHNNPSEATCRPRSVSGKHHSVIDMMHTTVM